MRQLLTVASLVLCLSLHVHEISAKIVGSRLTPATFAAHRVELAAFAAASLVVASPPTPDSLEVLSAFASCALPADVVVRGVAGELSGEVGLAPDWASRGLDERERRWVSACAAARMSAEAVEVPVSIRAPHLGASRAEREAWTLLEGAFAGDAFDLSSSLVACSGDGHHPDRLCAVPDPTNSGRTLCGFLYAGPCAASCRVAGGGFGRCLFGDQVITVYDLPL